MLLIRRHPITGKEIRQDLTELRSLPEMLASELSPGRALSEDVPIKEKPSLAANSYEIRSFSL